ncbi:MAG TPA: penicillin-binding transpeptidase domain-containing protein, partial [Thermomicrobiaceae bacterium]|nr:penicillin-binding transpeptidase domain-containing protein [Thermomicrobiaceae bacterium]
FNRATQGLYPIGSTFKVITTSAAMLYLGMGGDSPITCPASWTVPGTTQPVFKDWSYPNGQGTLTLSNALTQSCDTAMYQIGYQVDQKNPELLPNTAKAFGLGSPTGIPELPEATGVIPDPNWVQKNVPGTVWTAGDAVNLAIGQGYMTATPLQVADMYAAIANGGTVWQPYLVQKVQALTGQTVYAHKATVRSKLPDTPAQLQVIQTALQAVVNAPNGTAAGLSATHPFEGDPHAEEIAGKTGTAETADTAESLPDAWFSSFTPVQGAKMAMTAAVQNGGEGGDISAPLNRDVIDAFYQYMMPPGS